MEALGAAALVFGLLILALGAGLWVFVALLAVAIAALHVGLGFPMDRIGAIAKGVLWRASSGWELAAIPMFVFMGELIFRTDLSARLFAGLEPLVARVPGRLYHTNVLGCTLFAAVSGSSTATTATVGRMTTAALGERGYDPRLAVGSLAGAGSLGLLIPPSIMLIVYGVLAEVSITRLFAAGLLPGLMVAGLYAAYIAAACLFRPALAPAEPARRRRRLAETARLVLRGLGPVALLIVVVLGGIYSGIATPSEAAAVGVAATLALTAALGQLTRRLFAEALMSALKASCMIATLLTAAALLSTAMGYMHVPATIAQAIGALQLGPYALIALLALFYILLGFFLDGVSIVVMTLPITLPLALQAGFDPVWYGIFLVLMVELGLMTPPVGFNLFVLKAVTGRPLGMIARAAVPFFLLMLLATAILTVFPGIALWLPEQLG